MNTRRKIQRKFIRNISWVCFLFFIQACVGDLSDRIGGNFSSKEWKADELGCKNARIKMLESIQKADENIKLLTDSDIRRLFGKPDNIELFSRSQKFYIYYLEKGSQCQDREAKTGKGRALEVSLDALGRLHEVNIRN